MDEPHDPALNAALIAHALHSQSGDIDAFLELLARLLVDMLSGAVET